MKKIKLFALVAYFVVSPTNVFSQVIEHDNDSKNNESVVVTSSSTDNIPELFEGMDAAGESALEKWASAHYIISDTGCHHSNTNPTFTDQEYIDRLQRLQTVMEMTYNPVVRRYIDLYMGRLRRSVSFMLAASNFYVPIFEEALDRYGLPLELKYLPVIESALMPTAKSHAGAAGLWQFMIGTARRYGLDQSSLIDDRLDPIKSSDAAARYLRDLYKIYGDWNLVIAAYNCGPTNVEKAISRAGGTRDYWAIYPYLPRETRGYVPGFIAANYAMTYYCEHNICPMQSTLPQATDTLHVNRDLYFEQIADICHVSLDMLRDLNPQYLTNLIPGNAQTCVVRLPLGAITAFIDAKDGIYTYNLESLQTHRPTVEVDEKAAAPAKTTTRRTTTRTTSSKAKGKKATAKVSKRQANKRQATSKKTSTKKKAATKKTASKKKRR
ncbi:MAG: lytic transglycosylase domain-containing protein [Bacteroidales bacterium]|nr:lytic transglycosylase domain-containing protein [Bacteroidales bacterium]